MHLCHEWDHRVFHLVIQLCSLPCMVGMVYYDDIIHIAKHDDPIHDKDAWIFRNWGSLTSTHTVGYNSL